MNTHRRIVVSGVLLLLATSLACAQVSWNPTGLYSGNFIAVKQCQSNSGAYYMASTGTSVYRTADSGLTWTDVSAQFGGNTVYCFLSWTQTLQYYTVAGTSAGVYRSNDGGLTWTQATGTGKIPNTVSVWTLFDPGGGRMLAGTNDGIYFSLTYDQTFGKLATPAVTDAYAFTTYMISGQTTVYAGTSDGVWTLAYPSYGASWSELNNAETNARSARSLINAGSNLVAAVWDGATPLGIRTAPRTTAWVVANTGLGNLYVNGLAIATNLYAATDDGIWESTNGGGSWADYSSGLPSRVVKCINPVVGGAFCGPQGGGIYRKGTPILLPVLVSPPHNAVDVPVPATLTWTYPVGTPTYHDLQYSTSPTFASGNVAITNILTNTVDLPDLNPATNYYWRVRAFINGTLTSYSGTYKFTTLDFPVPPTAPTSILVTPASPLTTDDLTAVASGSVDFNPGTTITYSYEWAVSTNGGVSYGLWGHSGNMILAADTFREQKWKVRAQASDGILTSAWFESPTVITIGDTVPTAPTSITFTPASPTAGADVRPAASGALDIDGDQLTYSYQWAVSIGGAPFSGWILTSPILPGTSTQAGDVWKCQARANDGTLTSPWYESPTLLTISAPNTPPTTPTSVTLSPVAPFTADDVTATASGSTDVDGDAVSYVYQWSINGGAWGYDGEVLPAVASGKGDTIQARARALAAGQFSPDYGYSATVVIGDSGPSAPGFVTVGPNPATTTSTLTASAGGSVDPDGDPVSYRYEWGKFNGATWDWLAQATVTPAQTARNDRWKARAQAYNGAPEMPSAWVESTELVIGNLPPATPTNNVVTPAKPTSADDLVTLASGSTDPDGDPVTYDYQWSLSRNKGATWSDFIYPGATITAPQTQAGDWWRARARAFDGTSYSGWLTKGAVIVANTLPSAPTAVAITPDPAAWGDTLTAAASGAVDPDGDTLTYQYNWARSLDGGLTWSAFSWSGAALPAATVRTADLWKASARAYDGVGTTAWVQSAPVQLHNLVRTITPANGATGIARSAFVEITFVRGVDQASAQSHFALTSPGGGPLPGTFTWPQAHLRMRFTPTAALAASLRYTATLATGIGYQSGGGPTTWSEAYSFTTNGAPTVTSFSPSGNAAVRQSKLVVTFDSDMDTASVESRFYTSPNVSGTKSWTGLRTMTFTPSAALAAGTLYKVALASTATNSTGTPLGTTYNWSFTTNSAPVVTSFQPSGGTVATTSALVVTFDTDMDTASVDTRFYVSPNVMGNKVWTGLRTLTLTPTSPLTAGTLYKVALQAGAHSSTGVALGYTYNWSFTTAGAAPAQTAAAAVSAMAAPTANGAQVTVNLTADANVVVTICNVAGRVVAELPAKTLTAGVHSLLWNGRSTSGTTTPPGMYLVRISANAPNGTTTACVTPLRR